MSEEDNSHITVDFDAITRDAWRRSIVNVVDLLEPDAILDQFLEAELFRESTRIIVRDIREAGTTSAKNRAIHDRVSRDPRRYAFVKESLVRTRQIELLELLEKAEAVVHDEMIDKGRPCSCTATGSCRLIESLRCHRDLPEFLPNKVKVVQQKLVEIYEEKCLTVPVFDLIPDVKENLDRLYVKPNMQIIDIRGKRLASQKELTVKSYKDIFYKDNKPCKNIYITGEAGIGKSAFCESLVHTWCCAHTRSKDSSGETSENYQIMKQCPLLFYISLRYALEDIDIETMIEHQLGVDNARELLAKEDCLVVLDGLDEWTGDEKATGSRFTTKGLPKRSLKGNYTVVTTSRPWKLEKLRLGENEIDNQVNISELTKQSVEELVGRILTVMNEEHKTQKRVQDFMKCVAKSKLYDQLKTPVLLSLMTCLWYYDVSFGDSECEIYSNMINKQIELAEELKGLDVQNTTNVISIPSQKVSELPSCFKSTDNCKKYEHVLLALSKLAFEILFNEDREASLVFDHKDTSICGMSSSDMDICLKIGLLTQNKTFVNFIQKSKSISFIHKTHQEFFAALYLATLDHESAYNLLTSKDTRSLDIFLEVSKVILFLNGMNSKLGDDILSHVRELACEDQRVADYRLSCIGPCDKNYPLIKRVQYLLIDCENERHKNGLPCSTQQLDDLVAMDSNRLRHLMEHWDVLRPNHASSVSVQTMTRRNDDRCEAAQLWNKTFECARGSKCLQKLYIFDCIHCLDVSNIFMTVKDTRSTLTCLVLCAVNVSSLGERFRDLLVMPRLRTLGLGDFLFLTHEQINIVSEFLTEATYIEELRLKKFDCLTHPKGDTDCKIQFDASRNQSLRRLFVAGHIDKIRINTNSLTLLEARFIKDAGITKQLLECLKGSKKISEIELTSEYAVDKTAMVDIIPELKGLSKLRLLSMDFTGLSLMFPKCMTQLEHVLLQDVTINNSSLRHMIDNLPAQRVEIWMGNIKINQDVDTQFVKDYIRTSDKFQVTLDDPNWMYFHSVC